VREDIRIVDTDTVGVITGDTEEWRKLCHKTAQPDGKHKWMMVISLLQVSIMQLFTSTRS
jgi:hypothetical protein